MTKEMFLHSTRSVCPQCLCNLPADIVRRGDEVFLRRRCPAHGEVEEVIWRGSPEFTVWKRPKTYNSQFLRQGHVQRGCPFDCGLCDNHQQKSCAVLYELSDDCNLRCPVCFASSGKNPSHTKDNLFCVDKGEGSGSHEERARPHEEGFGSHKERARPQGQRGRPDGIESPVDQLSTITNSFALQKEYSHGSLDEHRDALRWIHRQAGQAILQLSGGEPTLSPWLIPLVKEASGLFPAVQLNTNGLLLAQDEGLADKLAESGLGWVFLQFDGTEDAIYEKLRGRPLLAIKKKAIANCRRAGLAVVLVPTVASGVNDKNLGDIVRFGLDHAPVVRGIHFQPMTRSGRNLLPHGPSLTLPEILQGLEEQTGGMVKLEHASPPGCEHERCSFHCRYTLQNGTLVHTPSSCCCAGNDDDSGAGSPARGTAHDADSTSKESTGESAGPWSVKAEYLQGRAEGSDQGADRAIASVVHNWQKAPEVNGTANEASDSFDAFIARHRATIFSITCMAFQDAWDLDLQRLQGCCIHVYAKPARLVPFCAYNLTDSGGRSLYRNQEKTIG